MLIRLATDSVHVTDFSARNAILIVNPSTVELQRLEN